MSLKTLAATTFGSTLAGGSMVALYPLPNLGSAVDVLRPRHHVRVIESFEVKGDGSKDFTTIKAALDAGTIFQNALMTSEGSTLRTPNYTVEIIVHPGVYMHTRALGLGQFLPVMSATGVPGDVVVRSEGVSGDLGTFESVTDFYLEGLDVVRAGTNTSTNAKYCHHIALHENETGVNVKCRFYTETANLTGGWTLTGMDGAPGVVVGYYDCALYAKSSGSYTPGGTNLHGLIGGAPAGSTPSHTIFSNCIGGDVGYQALTNLVPDQIWVDGGSYTSVTGTGSLTTLHHAGATGSMSAPGGVVTNITGMPVVAGGMSPATQAYYFGTPG